MDTAALFRVISLIPDRLPRSQSGSAFNRASSERAQLLSRFLGWLVPLNPIGQEEQQLLGVRAGGARALVEAEEAVEAPEAPEEVEDSSIRFPGLTETASRSHLG